MEENISTKTKYINIREGVITTHQTGLRRKYILLNTNIWEKWKLNCFYKIFYIKILYIYIYI